MSAIFYNYINISNIDLSSFYTKYPSNINEMLFNKNNLANILKTSCNKGNKLLINISENTKNIIEENINKYIEEFINVF